MKAVNKERLGELLHDVAWGWQKKSSYIMDRSEMMYDCTLFNCQDPEGAYEPIILNGMAIWDCQITTDCGNNWFDAEMSIPACLYDYYMKGKATFISWRKVECEVACKNELRSIDV
jgi:hypothetical protein